MMTSSWAVQVCRSRRPLLSVSVQSLQILSVVAGHANESRNNRIIAVSVRSLQISSVAVGRQQNNCSE